MSCDTSWSRTGGSSWPTTFELGFWSPPGARALSGRDAPPGGGGPGGRGGGRGRRGGPHRGGGGCWRRAVAGPGCLAPRGRRGGGALPRRPAGDNVPWVCPALVGYQNRWQGFSGPMASRFATGLSTPLGHCWYTQGTEQRGQQGVG